MSARRAQRLSLEELAPHLLATPNPPAPLNWRAVFGNDHPVEVEVGFGKGLFLITTAPQHPETNYLGIEIVRKYQLFTANRVAKRHLGNVRLAWADARLLLRDCVPAETLQAVHVYFPDPWWKQRHHKRRVFTPEFAALCERSLRPGGILSVATDVGEYFEIITGLLAQLPRLQPQPPPSSPEPSHDLDYLTNFERKFRKQGQTIHRAIYEKSGGEGWRI